MGRNTFRGILELWLFNVFLCALFFSMNERDFATFVDDNTPYVTNDRIKDVIDSIKLFKWFVDNQMKAKKGKCHLLISASKNTTINVDSNIIEKSICEKLLHLNVDYKLKFNKHLESIFRKNRPKCKYSLENIVLQEF